MTAYYNEIDPYAAAWLRNLIDAGHIAPGVVDTRSIEDITPDDLRGYTQCHFFAGIGVWSHALRRAGWPDDKPVWTGSCPCQPFSAAGKGAGFADERHLWPAWHYLIEECRPPVVFGEQVASKDGLGWLDLVQADMEAAGYAVGPVDLCAAGIGAPHIRQRLWFVAERLADAVGIERERQPNVEPSRVRGADVQPAERRDGLGDLGASAGGVADTGHSGLQGRSSAERGVERQNGQAAAYGASGGLADAESSELQRGEDTRDGRAGTTGSGGVHGGLADAATDGHTRDAGAGRQAGDRTEQLCSPDGPGPTNGHWRAADWLFCRDGKWRPVEPGTFPLAHGAANRVGRLRAYGNAIVAQAAQEVITAYMADEAADLI